MTTDDPGGMPARNRLLYSVGAIGGNAISRTLDLWLLFFYLGDADGSPPRRASAAAIAFVLVLVRIIESLDDPIIGFMSDRTRSRLGRRIPYILLATPFMALLFVFVWTPPQPGEHTQNVLYLFAVLWGFHLFSTLSGGPYEALLPEIASTQRDRLSISTWAVFFGVIGAVLALVVSGPLIDAVGFAPMAVLMATVGLVTRYAGMAGAWRRAIDGHRNAPPPPDETRMWVAIRSCLRNDQFRYFLPSYVLYHLGVQLITGVLPFLVQAILHRDKPGSMVAALTGTAIGTLVLVLPVMLVVARTRGKRAVYGWGMLFGALYFPFMAFIGLVPGVPVVVQALVYAAPLGLALAPVQTFPAALIADICDYDRLLTGTRREGTFYSVQNTFEKTAGAFAPGILALLLTIGSTPEDTLGIRLVGPIAGMLVLVGYLVFRQYKLADHVTSETVLELRASRSGTAGPERPPVASAP